MRGRKSRFICSATLAAAFFTLTAAAFAQTDPKIGVSFGQFVPLEVNGVGQVSQSRIGSTTGQKSFLSQVTYKFQIDNTAASSLNRPFLDLTLSNPGGSEFPTISAIVSTSPPVDCPFTPDSSISVYCTFPDLAPHTGSLTVYVIVNVPSSGSLIEARWSGGGYEGNGGNNGCCQPSDTYTTYMVDKLIDQSYKYTLQTFVKKEGAELFTGDEGIPKPGKGSQAPDLNTTIALIPTIATAYPTDSALLKEYAGNIFESSMSCPGTAFKSGMCYESQITVPALDFSKGGTITEVSIDADLGQTVAGAPDELLDVTLRVDQSAMKGGAKPGDFKLFYEGVEVPACSNYTPYATTRSDLPPGTLVYQTSWLPCYTTKQILQGGGKSNDLKGDLEIRGKHYKNGGWRIL